MRALTLVLVALFAPFVRGDDRLNGTWTAIALQADGKNLILEDGGRFRFAGGKVTWLLGNPEDVTIPLHGTSFDCKFDRSRSPHRLEMSYQEFGKNVWAYCIYDVKGNTLMVRMLLPLIVTQDYVTDETRRKFTKDPYPKEFATAKGDATALLIFRRTNEKLPVKQK